MTDLRSIVMRLGGDLSSCNRKARIPGPGHSPRDRSMSLALTEDGRLLYYSFAGDSAEAMRSHLGLEEIALFKSVEFMPRMFRLAEIRAEQNRKLSFCRALWERCGPSQGTLAHTYLRARMIDIHTMPEALRFCADAPRGYESESRSPAMVAQVTDATGQACGLHLTFLREDGGANVGRVMMGSVAGGCVRLFPPRPHLAVAEGIETALAYSYMKGVCCWASLSTSGLMAFSVPDGCERVTVAADNDKSGAGLRAADKLISRHPAGFMTLDMPETAGTDWNDVVRNTLAT